ncbi:FMN-dependent NADH-azoreductase [Thalassospira sp.]|uniref:FMN-dependent NADH-azoreductase n=1 Tax=Thalassospira sp. TaxID=1912094 RepID=UPI0027353506|nr:NAD(P)H-dependent oxidoreductase [Thalassospira sp.]MDP2698496.1 NAD(P)H-dependent oxidoreductase [Thalassospira sp.]
MAVVLRIDTSVNGDNSKSLQLSSKLVDRIVAADPATDVVVRNVNDHSIPALNGEIVGAYFTPAENRSEDQKKIIAASDMLVAELFAADTLVIGVPMYNFSIPSRLKVWVDLVARAGVTFQYTENGPKGLIEGKKAYLVVSTGGVPVNSPADFATPYMKQFLAFLGITDVTVIDASGFAVDADAAMTKAVNAIETVALPNAA